MRLLRLSLLLPLLAGCEIQSSTRKEPSPPPQLARLEVLKAQEEYRYASVRATRLRRLADRGALVPEVAEEAEHRARVCEIALRKARLLAGE